MTVDLSGSLHSHTFHTDYRNPNERSKSPFDLGYFVRRCMEYGRNFQAVTDIRARRLGFPDFDEQRYIELIKTADPNDNSYELEASKTEARVYIPSTREVFYILRTQEVLTNVPKKHVLAVNVGDMPGGESPEETLKRIKGGGGFAIIDHPFMCGAWNEDEIHRAYEVGLIGAIEWNGGLTFPACLDLIPGLKYKTPSKHSNTRALSMEREYGVRVVANDDSHCEDDVRRGAYTTYKLDTDSAPIAPRIIQAIVDGRFQRHERYSAFLSPVHHVINGARSQRNFGEDGLPSA